MEQLEPFTGSWPMPTTPKFMMLVLPRQTDGVGAERPLELDAGGLIAEVASAPSSTYDVADAPGSVSCLKSVLPEF